MIRGKTQNASTPNVYGFAKNKLEPFIICDWAATTAGDKSRRRLKQISSRNWMVP